jgi:hypothetical protein
VVTLASVLVSLVVIIFGSIYSFAKAIKDGDEAAYSDENAIDPAGIPSDITVLSEENLQKIKEFNLQISLLDKRIGEIDAIIGNDKVTPEEKIAHKSLYDEKASLLLEKLSLCKTYKNTCVIWAQETRDLLADPIGEYEKYYEMYKDRLSLVYEIGLPSSGEVFESSKTLMDLIMGNFYIDDIERYDDDLARKVSELYGIVEEGLGNVKYYLAMSEIYEDLREKAEEDFFDTVNKGYKYLSDKILDPDCYNLLVNMLPSEIQSMKKLVSEARDEANVKPSAAVKYSFPTNESFFYTDYVETVHGSRYVWSEALGKYVNLFHSGIDISTSDILCDVLACADGTVIYSGYCGLRGYTVVLLHKNGVATVYSGCSSTTVSVGDTVRLGDRVALSGMSGNAQYFGFTLEMFDQSGSVDPTEHIKMPDVSLG